MKQFKIFFILISVSVGSLSWAQYATGPKYTPTSVAYGTSMPAPDYLQRRPQQGYFRGYIPPNYATGYPGYYQMPYNPWSYIPNIYSRPSAQRFMDYGSSLFRRPVQRYQRRSYRDYDYSYSRPSSARSSRSKNADSKVKPKEKKKLSKSVQKDAKSNTDTKNKKKDMDKNEGSKSFLKKAKDISISILTIGRRPVKSKEAKSKKSSGLEQVQNSTDKVRETKFTNPQIPSKTPKQKKTLPSNKTRTVIKPTLKTKNKSKSRAKTTVKTKTKTKTKKSLRKNKKQIQPKEENKKIKTQSLQVIRWVFDPDTGDSYKVNAEGKQISKTRKGNRKQKLNKPPEPYRAKPTPYKAKKIEQTEARSQEAECDEDCKKLLLENSNRSAIGDFLDLLMTSPLDKLLNSQYKPEAQRFISTVSDENYNNAQYYWGTKDECGETKNRTVYSSKHNRTYTKQRDKGGEWCYRYLKFAIAKAEATLSDGKFLPKDNKACRGKYKFNTLCEGDKACAGSAEFSDQAFVKLGYIDVYKEPYKEDLLKKITGPNGEPNLELLKPGAVIVYEGGKYGHVEFKGTNGFSSDYVRGYARTGKNSPLSGGIGTRKRTVKAIFYRNFTGEKL